jgi:hypothetical protein
MIDQYLSAEEWCISRKRKNKLGIIMDIHKQVVGYFSAKIVLVALLSLTLGSGCTEQVDIPDNIRDQPTYQDQKLLEQAWALPVAAKYRDTFEYQINWAFCGPAAAVNVFLSVDINTYTQKSIFENTQVSYWKARFLGLTLDEMAEVVSDNSTFRVEKLRGLTREEFHQHLQRSNDPSYRYLINFTRLPLFGVSIGHHSPIGGYLVDKDLVLVLDVLEDYKPFLVSGDRLYDAMNTIDSETDKKRGLILLHVPTD